MAADVVYSENDPHPSSLLEGEETSAQQAKLAYQLSGRIP